MDQRHLQNRPQPHDVGTGGRHIFNQLQPLCARIWRLADVLHTCPLDALAFPSTDDKGESTSPACSTIQTPQATLKIWTCAGAKDPSRGTAAEEPRRQLRRTVSRTKQRGGGASGSASVLTKPKGDGKVDQKSLGEICSRPSSKRIRR